MKENRTLAAIIFTDGVNFSALMSKDEEHTLNLIRRDLQLMTELCQRFDGQVLKSTGDGLLMYFTSAVQAVTCAVEIQNQLAQTAAQLSPNDILKHRIGIHLGDVFFTENDVMGNGVNIAARLQTVAEPGAICISQTVYDVVKNGLSLPATYLGMRELKNIQDAVPVYQIILPSSLSNLPQKAGNVPERNINKEEYRNRKILLNKVKNYWIKGVLETSLHGKVLIELGMKERLDAIERPWGLVWETSDGEGEKLPKETKLIDKFNDLGAGRTMLILGDPGAGKTTTLLELTRDLIISAEHDITQPIPVVFNLSSWINNKQKIADWVIQELYAKYQVSREISKEWVKNQQLLLMLDGLDEVSAERRDACVQAINQFSQNYGQTEMVVASRLKDYQNLAHRLKLQGAICLEPLSLEQIDEYLTTIGAEVAAVKAAIAEDVTLQELARSPLILSIITLAYQGKNCEELCQINSLEERRKHLFDAYIDRMFKRRFSQTQAYTKEQTMHWLTCLAQKLADKCETVFLIEGLQPNWWLNKQQKIMFAIGIGVISFCSLFVTGGLVGFLVRGISAGLIYGLILGLGGGLISGVFWGIISNHIKPVTSFKWSSKKAQDSLWLGCLIGLIFGLTIAISAGIISWLVYGLDTWFNEVVNYGVRFSISGAVIFVLQQGLTGASIEMSTFPNQGIWQSTKNAIAFALIVAICLIIAAQLMEIPLIVGVISGLLLGIFGFGESCIKHFILRLILYYNGYIPWNYARFLDWSTEHIFLQKVGGGYIFIHRLLLEHFAQMKIS